MLELEARGADLIELGVPFSDPMADGPANQRALARGLASGASLAAILAMVSELRRESQIPIVLFGYYNPILHYGCERLCADAARAGVDGLLVVDLPPEEAAELARPARAHGLDIIYLLAPTTPIERVRTIARAGSGFLYYVAVTGVTGTRTSLAAGLETRVRALRAVTDLPDRRRLRHLDRRAGGRGRGVCRRGRGRKRAVVDNRARGRGARTCGGGGRSGGCDEECDARGARSWARHGGRLSDGGAGAGRARRHAAQSAADENIWVKCPGCREIAFRKEVERNLNVCPKCGYHHRLTVEQRLAITIDRGSWRELFEDLAAGDPLEFHDSKPYPQRLEQARRASGRNDAVVTGVGKIEGHPVALAVMDFAFMGGSMGTVVGEKIARLIDHALKHGLGVVVFCSSGGARMQEGVLSLMQMAKVAGAIGRLRDAHLPYLAVLCDPTTGGVAASFAMLGDLNLAEPGALIGFAGRRVIEQTTNQVLPEGFQSAEFLIAHGMLDAIVPRAQMRVTLARLLGMLAGRGTRGRRHKPA